ncbi:MAG: glycosyltransferase family 2 protein [Prevotella sp.]|nr:glycosyltransferase family 2 protein [Prevotella sp.]
MGNNLSPLITVITVCYNCKNDIESTILSVIRQKFHNYEYIIIDGGSNDGTFEIIDKYKDNISTIVSEPDNGIFDAMNKGLRLAHGQWIIFMNAGDYFYSDTTLLKASEYLVDNKYIVYGNTEYRRPNGKKIEEAFPVTYLSKNMPTCHQSFFVRTEKAREIGFQTRYKYSADYNMMYRLYKKYGSQNITHIPLTIASYEAINGLTISNAFEVYHEVQTIRDWSLNKILCYINYYIKKFLTPKTHKI